jgi:hypothetical protein
MCFGKFVDHIAGVSRRFLLNEQYQYLFSVFGVGFVLYTFGYYYELTLPYDLTPISELHV